MFYLWFKKILLFENQHPQFGKCFFSFISVRLELFFFRSIFFSFSHEKEKNRASRARIELFWGNIAGTLQSEDIPGWCWNMLEQPPAVYLELWIICWLEIFCNPCKAAHLYFVCSGCLFIYWLPSFFFAVRDNMLLYTLYAISRFSIYPEAIWNLDARVLSHGHLCVTDSACSAGNRIADPQWVSGWQVHVRSLCRVDTDTVPLSSMGKSDGDGPPVRFWSDPPDG